MLAYIKKNLCELCVSAANAFKTQFHRGNFLPSMADYYCCLAQVFEGGFACVHRFVAEDFLDAQELVVFCDTV